MTGVQTGSRVARNAPHGSFPDWQPAAAPRETPPNVTRKRAERPLVGVASN